MPPAAVDRDPSPSPADGAELAVGGEIGGYRIEELRREGATASLYRATQMDTGQPVALKVLHRDLGADRQALERFRREADAVNQLRHPRIVRILACGELAPGRPFIAMEWLEGRNLE